MHGDVGADGLLLVTPYYNKCTQAGLYTHYEEIAKSTPLPIILYNVPSRTGVNIEIETLNKLSKIKNIVGLKDATGNLNYTAQAIYLAKQIKNFAIYSGNDDLTLPILSIGGMGVISVTANIYPKQVHSLCEYSFNSKEKDALKLYYDMLEINKVLFCEVNPIPIKEAMNILDMDVGNVRLPLSKMSEQNRLILENCLKNTNELLN